MKQPSFVYCTQHLAVHRLKEDGSCWCGVIEDDLPGRGTMAVVLDAQTEKEAKSEVRRRFAYLKPSYQPFGTQK